MELNNIEIRETRVEDFKDIFNVESQAFGYDKEAKLTTDLLTDKSAEPMVSLLAIYKQEAVGHILFTRAYFEKQQEQPLMHILAPLAVKPEFQRNGIGGMLLKAGIQILQEKGSNLVFVLGHREYYPRYSFIPQAGRLGYPVPFPIPEEYADCWMVRPISKNRSQPGHPAGKPTGK